MDFHFFWRESLIASLVLTLMLNLGFLIWSLWRRRK